MTSDSVATIPVAASPMVVAVSASSPSPAAAPGATLHHTMAAVVAAVESLDRRDSTQARQVDFQFQVGHEQLSLRLELKAGTIQATFHTNSTELRHALTHEWEAVMPTTIGSGLSVAQPVFSSSPGDGMNSTFGSFPQGGAQERGQPEPERPANGRRPDYAAGARSDAAPPEVSLPNVLSLLNTFA